MGTEVPRQQRRYQYSSTGTEGTRPPLHNVLPNSSAQPRVRALINCRVSLGVFVLGDLLLPGEQSKQPEPLILPSAQQLSGFLQHQAQGKFTLHGSTCKITK